MFTPLKEFEYVRNGVLIAKYLPGMTYNCTRHPKHDTLYEKCLEWEGEGAIRRIPLNPMESFQVVEVR